MYIKQLSVFIENREGRLEEVLDVLKKRDVNIVSLSLADTSDYGLLRLLVTKPEEGKAALLENGFSAMLTDVLGIKLRHRVGQLQELLEVICIGLGDAVFPVPVPPPGEAPLHHQPYPAPVWLFGPVAAQVSGQLGAGGFQLRGLVEKGLAVSHSRPLFLMGHGGRIYSQKKLSFQLSVLLLVLTPICLLACAMGWAVKMGCVSKAPLYRGGF